MVRYRLGPTVLLTALVLTVLAGHGALKFSPIVFAQSRSQLTVEYDLPYGHSSARAQSDRRTLDLYHPGTTGTKPPLVALIPGDLFLQSDVAQRIGQSFAQELVIRDVAVALIRYRSASPHPAGAEDIAEALAYLVQGADRYGYDPKKIYLAGHSSGAHLAALIALDPSYLAARGLTPASIAGVISLSGVYDLSSQSDPRLRKAMEKIFGKGAAALKAASPIAHASAKAPPFLILTAADDFQGSQIGARRFAEALRAKGQTRSEPFVVAHRDHLSLGALQGPANQVRSLVLGFLKVAPPPPELAELLELKRRWREPAFSTVPFWSHKRLIRWYPIDERFRSRLQAVYNVMAHELQQWSLERYYAIDLFAYLDALPKEQAGRGNYLVITNARNERQVWQRGQIEAYRPVIVVGIDEERNLFRFAVFYRMLMEYSWKPGPQPPAMALPLGAFIHFLKQPPAELKPQSWHYGLTAESFQLKQTDPLAPLSHMPKKLYEVLTHKNGCVYCHSLRGVGARSHHITATTGSAHGGFALPLEEYPPGVWKDFVFYQYQVAEKVGATPNVVGEDSRQLLHDLVVKYREQRSSSQRR